jgi:hypothetical protein
MGRKAISKEDIKTKRQERNQKYLSNHDALTRTRESNRLKMQERRRRERLTSLDPHALLADTAIQAEMRDVNEEEERRCSDHDDGDGDGDGDDNDDAFDRPDFYHGGFGDDDWEGQGFDDDGFDDMESISIMIINIDVYR